MDKLSDLKLKYRFFMGTYRYRQLDWRPSAVLEKPLSQSRIAVVTTADFFRPEQPPFDPSIRSGDYSFREISVETDLDTLQIAHVVLPISSFAETEGTVTSMEGRVQRLHVATAPPGKSQGADERISCTGWEMATRWKSAAPSATTSTCKQPAARTCSLWPVGLDCPRCAARFGMSWMSATVSAR